MKIDMLSEASRKAGGLFYSVRWLTQELQRQGETMRLLSNEDESTAADLHHWDPVPVVLHPGRGPLAASREIRTLLDESDADLLHVQGIWLDRQWAALRWQKKNGGPVVISPRGMLDPWALSQSRWKKKLVGLLFAEESLRRAACIHALCDSEYESIRAYGLKNPVAVIPNGVELPEMKERSFAERGRKKLLFIGRIHPKKGIEELLRGWASAKGMAAAWELTIAGWDDGGHEGGLNVLAKELGIGQSVSFVGSKYGDEKDRLLREADAFVLPSYSEGLPMSVLEAWSYGLPVLMTEFCNLPEGFSAGAAVRIEPDSASVAAGLEQLGAMCSDELRQMGGRGRALVEEKFTWPRIAEAMRQVYAWCLSGEHPPECMRFD